MYKVNGLVVKLVVMYLEEGIRVKKMKSVVGLAVGVTLFGSLLAGCDSDEGKVTKDPKVSEEKKAVGIDKDTVGKKEISVKLMTTVFDGGEYTLTFNGNKDVDTKTFMLTYKNTLKKDVKFTYADNKRVSFVLLNGEGELVAKKVLDVEGDVDASESIAKGDTFGYWIDVEDVPNGIYTLQLTHHGKSDDVKSDLMVLPGITFGDKDVTVTNVSKTDTSVKKVTEDRPVVKDKPKTETKEAKPVSKEKVEDTKKPDVVSDKTPDSTKESADKAEDAKSDDSVKEGEKVPAIKADVVFNGWADSHSVEVMMGDTPAVFQVSDKAVPAIEKLEAGEKVSFVFTQNGMTRTVLAVMK